MPAAAPSPAPAIGFAAPAHPARPSNTPPPKTPTLPPECSVNVPAMACSRVRLPPLLVAVAVLALEVVGDGAPVDVTEPFDEPTDEMDEAAA